MQTHTYTNELIHETSPYLLQHAHNPVNWVPWGDKALERARRENKLLLISIGYSACHWCHVMEHESFEDKEVARLMNIHYVCIKVDREERPDVDHTYMSAVQLLTGRGGWPLNCIALPDGRPIWAGTYFRKEEWTEALEAIANFYRENPEKTQEYASKLHEGMQQNALIALSAPGPCQSRYGTDKIAGCQVERYVRCQEWGHQRSSQIHASQQLAIPAALQPSV
jgi:uncharacterized protein YyaL (SSP411 family)